MKLLLTVLSVLLLQSFVFAANPAFIPAGKQSFQLESLSAMNENSETPCAGSPHPFTMLPGDPSLILHTNVDLGDKKLEIMKGN
jgi:hypothetical protein